MVGVTVEEIQEEFSDLDLDITDDEVLFKLKVGQDYDWIQRKTESFVWYLLKYL